MLYLRYARTWSERSETKVLLVHGTIKARDKKLDLWRTKGTVSIPNTVYPIVDHRAFNLYVPNWRSPQLGSLIV